MSNPIDPKDGSPITGMKGLFLRGLEDACPPDHFQDCNNVIFPGPNQVRTREGSSALTGLLPGNGSTFFQGALNGSPFIISMSAGVLYASISFHDFSSSGANDFVAVNMSNRIYISPTKDGAAIAGEFLYYYDGVNLLKAGIAAPVSAPTATQPSAGNVTLGDHSFVVCFQTANGFISNPGPPVTITADGVHNVLLSAVPVGLGGTITNVVVLMTKANETEYFFAKTVANGTVTIAIDLADTDLVVSGDYLFDILASPPSAADLIYYKGRLILVGPAGDFNAALCSEVVNPETFNPTTSRIVVPNENDGNILRTAFELRSTLYLCKFAGIYSTQDSGDEPRNWVVDTVDAAYGVYSRGKAAFTSAMSSDSNTDKILVVDKAGLFLFTGTFIQTPLSWKIETLWRSIPIANFLTMSAAHDIIKKRIYICSPVDQFILMADYTDGLDPVNIKWSKWTFSSAVCIGMALLAADPVYTLRLTVPSNNKLYGIKDALTQDDGVNYASFFTLAPQSKAQGIISVFTAINCRAIGAATLIPSITNEKKDVTVNLNSFALTSTAYDFFRTMNMETEKISIKFAATLGYFHINRVDLYGRAKWLTRPQ